MTRLPPLVIEIWAWLPIISMSLAQPHWPPEFDIGDPLHPWKISQNFEGTGCPKDSSTVNIRMGPLVYFYDNNLLHSWLEFEFSGNFGLVFDSSANSSVTEKTCRFQAVVARDGQRFGVRGIEWDSFAALGPGARLGVEVVTSVAAAGGGEEGEGHDETVVEVLSTQIEGNETLASGARVTGSAFVGHKAVPNSQLADRRVNQSEPVFPACGSAGDDSWEVSFDILATLTSGISGSSSSSFSPEPHGFSMTILTSWDDSCKDSNVLTAG